MTQVKIKEHPSTDICIATTLFNSYFVFDSECSLKDIEDMVSTWVNIVYDREIVDAIVDEELENLDRVSVKDFDVYYDDCKEEDIWLYTYIGHVSNVCYEILHDKKWFTSRNFQHPR